MASVKRLHWIEQYPGSFAATALGLRYIVVDRQWWCDGVTLASECASDEAGMAEAQLDFEQRVHAVLIEPQNETGT